MVSTAVKVMTPGQRAKARLQRIKDARPKIPSVKVEPVDGNGFKAADMRRLLHHPKAGGFRSEGSVSWPNDTFTQRRLKEGSIKLAEGAKTSSSTTRTHDAA